MISFIQKGAAVSGTGAAGVGVTVNPAYADVGTINPGDILFIHAGSQRGGMIGSISTTDPDWTPMGSSSIFQDSAPVNAGNAVLLYKIADGSESGTVPILAFSDDDVDVIAQMYKYRQSTGQAIRVEDHNSKTNGNGS